MTVDREQQGQGNHQHRNGDSRRADVVVLLELGIDQKRCDFRHHGHVAGNKSHRTVFTDGARKGEREAGGLRRRDRGSTGLPLRKAGAGRRAARSDFGGASLGACRT